MLKHIHICLFLFALFWGPTLAQAADPANPFEKKVEFGIPKGSVIPHDLSFVDQKGQQRNFKNLVGYNGLVLIFIRSADWSRHCLFQLEEISKKGFYLEDLGWNIVVVSYDHPARIQKFLKEYHFEYPFLADTTSEIIKAFGLRNQSYVKGTVYYGVAHPATYIIGKDGVVVEKFFNENVAERPSVAELQRYLRSIGTYRPILEDSPFSNNTDSSR